MLTQNNVKKYLYYHPESGDFVWIDSAPTQRHLIGTQAGGFNKEGYLHIRIDGKWKKLSRLAWYFVYGVWPTKFLDHKNRSRHDNRIDNLREATPTQNAQNHGRVPIKNNNMPLGIRVLPSGRYHVRVQSYKKTYYIGTYTSLEKAIKEHSAARLKYHDFYDSEGA